VPAKRVQAYVLDARGQRAGTMTVHDQGGNTVLTIGGASGTLWYEVDIQ